MVPKKEKETGESKKESRRRRGGRARRKGARGVCLGGRECAPERGWEAGLATGSAELLQPAPTYIPHPPDPRPKSRGLAANLKGGEKSGGGRRASRAPILPFLGPGTAIKIREIDSVPTSGTLGSRTRPHQQPAWEETNPVIHVGDSQVAPRQLTQD